MRVTQIWMAGALLASSSIIAAAPITSQFPARILAAHNRERAAVGVTPLVWDSILAVGAAAYAQQMARTGIFEHSDRHARRGIAENIWYGSHGYYSPEQMVGTWTSEKPRFVPGIFPNVSRTGNWYDVSHYSQVIWPLTQRIGCALASTGRVDYLVCRYSPSGNIDGKHVP
jgi:hypothetical protein